MSPRKKTKAKAKAETNEFDRLTLLAMRTLRMDPQSELAIGWIAVARALNLDVWPPDERGMARAIRDAIKAGIPHVKAVMATIDPQTLVGKAKP